MTPRRTSLQATSRFRAVPRWLLALGLGASAGSLAVAAATSRNVIIIQPSSPVAITEYKAEYEQSGSAGQGINHVVSYTNRGRQRVSAVRFGLVAFDVFNGFMGKIDGIAMNEVNANRSQKGNWLQTPPSAFSFLTGVAYVDTVRLDDGTVWQSDNDTVLEELRKVDKSFELKLLKPPAR